MLSLIGTACGSLPLRIRWQPLSRPLTVAIRIGSVHSDHRPRQLAGVIRNPGRRRRLILVDTKRTKCHRRRQRILTARRPVASSIPRKGRTVGVERRRSAFTACGSAFSRDGRPPLASSYSIATAAPQQGTRRAEGRGSQARELRNHRFAAPQFPTGSPIVSQGRYSRRRLSSWLRADSQRESLAAYEAAPHTRSAPVFRSVSRYRRAARVEGKKRSPKRKKPQVSFPLGLRPFMPRRQRSALALVPVPDSRHPLFGSGYAGLGKGRRGGVNYSSSARK